MGVRESVDDANNCTPSPRTVQSAVGSLSVRSFQNSSPPLLVSIPTRFPFQQQRKVDGEESGPVGKLRRIDDSRKTDLNVIGPDIFSLASTIQSPMSTRGSSMLPSSTDSMHGAREEHPSNYLLDLDAYECGSMSTITLTNPLEERVCDDEDGNEALFAASCTPCDNLNKQGLGGMCVIYSECCKSSNDTKGDVANNNAVEPQSLIEDIWYLDQTTEENLKKLEADIPINMLEWSSLLSHCSKVSREHEKARTEEKKTMLLNTLRCMYRNLESTSVVVGAEELLVNYVKEKCGLAT